MASGISKPAFCQPSDTADISVFDSDGRLVATDFNDNEEFTQYIQKSACPNLRIVSIYSQISILPLKISKDALETLRIKYSIGPELCDLASMFGNKPLSAGAGEGAITVQERDNGIKDISFSFTFPVQTGADRWTMRQVGVFHSHDPMGIKNLWIFLHVGPNTPAQREIEIFASQVSQRAADATWFALHSAALSPYLGSWRSYVNYLGFKVDHFVDHSLTLILSEIENSTWTNEKLKDLHYYGDLILPIRFRLEVAIATLAKLRDLSKEFSSTQDDVNGGFSRLATHTAYHKIRLERLVAGSEVIGHKVKDVLDKLEIVVNLRLNNKMLDLSNRMVELNNRLLTVNGGLLELGKENFDENATVKVVTLVTLIYLPASLVSSVLGMNLFKFGDGTTENFTISRQFWIFVVATAILAIITVGCWFIWTHKERLKRGKHRLLFPKSQILESVDREIGN
ncbi:uncharacterized protein N7473_008965 [Penicillium subrubescens]|uniref:uncharacterized protein n=1 Tax=Penicillium subrubescens TaxID=1316194 RepID=UPI002544EF59|nr:uncharacterized protein N7473_008965 [Penicillium subrubescens]KAJ5886291.1 hypothetical protein N7473_008965 [Penicillium subrubescens]